MNRLQIEFSAQFLCACHVAPWMLVSCRYGAVIGLGIQAR